MSGSCQFLSRETLSSSLGWIPLINALREIFTENVVCPTRLHYPIDEDNPSSTANNILLIMPCWIPGKFLGVKQVNVFPENTKHGLPSLSSHYLLSDATTGCHLAQLDGNELTSRRTAAASALASSYLSKEDSTSLLIIGSGKVAEKLIHAHCSVRPIRSVRIWNHRFESAKSLASRASKELPSIQIDAVPIQNLENAVKCSDIISSATLSKKPIIVGSWINPGTHIDLVGGFTPHMHEADSKCIQISNVFVDTRKGALHEAGDLLTPIKEGLFSPNEVIADLFDLCNNKHSGRSQLKNPAEAITLFKSVGDSREDLAAASLAYKVHNKSS
ncbi:ornithine cyclodeaminase-like protein [Schizosaccharomyces pombe]|uniref:Uncharacterized protein P11E10.01 n=1 Tax=Schizosaccharomyces pombe (strain 972 / ATCC 24843) TaxID=284812 RepID=YK01_SCHPO|nr:putative ornithine cyclodeaminase family protein [Schizosaccharomyces pombe]Q9HDZ0.1 RecName: Full=Uncharacterized protein P11E10.01 [Schizosaccharomyces pombe 972h-]CAC19749.1 ornithine cyclodeaminase family (predicted) [Schizosaccharomyces pombe]|eukprot:NP_593514.1 putative ornithine cyclodeaminase family protein [Schizosaccharomyces pombe]